MAAPCNEEQRGQAIQKPCNRVRSVLTQWVKRRVTPKLNTHAVLQALVSGQLRFLGLFTLEADFTPERSKQLAALRWIHDHPDHGQLFVLRDANRVLGMANALIGISTAEGGPVLILEDVIVATGYRGKGCGRKLVEHVLAWAAAEGMSRVTLLADRDNAAALAFYERLGFEESAMVVRRFKLRKQS